MWRKCAPKGEGDRSPQVQPCPKDLQMSLSEDRGRRDNPCGVWALMGLQDGQRTEVDGLSVHHDVRACEHLHQRPAAGEAHEGGVL